MPGTAEDGNRGVAKDRLAGGIPHIDKGQAGPGPTARFLEVVFVAGAEVCLDFGLDGVGRRQDVGRVDRAFPDLGGARHGKLLDKGQRLFRRLEDSRVAGQAGVPQDLVEVPGASANFGGPVRTEQRIIHAFENAVGFHSGPEPPGAIGLHGMQTLDGGAAQLRQARNRIGPGETQVIPLRAEPAQTFGERRPVVASAPEDVVLGHEGGHAQLEGKMGGPSFGTHEVACAFGGPPLALVLDPE